MIIKKMKMKSNILVLLVLILCLCGGCGDYTTVITSETPVTNPDAPSPEPIVYEAMMYDN